MIVEQKQFACGLMVGGKHVPLEGVRVDARLSGASVAVTVTQRYRNRESVPVEAVYVFPLEEGAAVCGFAALVGGKLVEGRVEEREKAFALYDDAMTRGDGAFLLDQERPNVFTASVGNLRPDETVEIRIRYVALSAREGDAIRLAIPTTVSPRYVPKGPPEVGEPDGERVNPPHWPSVPYGLALTVDVDGDGLREVDSPSHPIRTTLRDGGATVSLSSDAVALDRDFVLLVSRKEPRRPQAIVAREADGRRVAMVTFLPDLAATDAGHEVLFLLDCSGSMGGPSIEQARRALSLCVRALRTEDTFNVVRFGSSFESLWKSPRRFDDASLSEATKYIERIGADLGGTEILAPLVQLLEAKLDPERPRRVLVLTDGQVSNESDVLALARKHAGNSRIFAFGIGAGASEHLVRGAARASRGAAEMIFPGERIEPKVLRMFDRVRTPVLDDVRVDWKELRVEQAPHRVPPVFNGEALTVFARIESGSATAVDLVVGERRFGVPLDLEHAEPVESIPVLWAREAIRELDDETTPRGSAQRRPEADERRRARLVELGTRYGLLSSATSYVAIEERERSSGDQPAELRRIPVALTTGWGGSAGRVRAPVMMRLGAMAMPPPMPSSPAPMSGGAVRSRAFATAAAPPPAPAGFMSRLKRALFPDVAPAGSAALGGGAPAEPSDPLYDILMTQRAEGSFARSAALDAWLGPERAARLAREAASSDERIVVTATVVLLLEKEHAAREGEWRAAVNKAKVWLVREASVFDASVVVGG